VSLVALRLLPLFVVQSLLAGSLALTVLLAVPVLHVRPTRRDLVAVVVVTAGLAGVALSSGRESTAPPPAGYATTVTVAALVTAAVAALAWRQGRPLACATLAGIGFSGLALAARAVQAPDGLSLLGLIGAVLAQPVAWAVLAFGLVGAVMYARGLEKGRLGPVTAVMWVVEVVLPGIVGVAVLGDGVRAGWAPAALAGVVAAVGGCIVLALSPTQEAIGA